MTMTKTSTERPPHQTNDKIQERFKTAHPKVERAAPEHREFMEQRDTMQPQNGEKLPQQGVANSDNKNLVDHHLPDHNDKVPVKPAEVKGGMRT